MCSPEKKILLQWILQNKLNQTQHKILANWLEVDSYIPPSERKLAVETINVLISEAENATDMFEAWTDADIIETFYTEAEQIEVCQIFD